MNPTKTDQIEALNDLFNRESEPTLKDEITMADNKKNLGEKIAFIFQLGISVALSGVIGWYAHGFLGGNTKYLKYISPEVITIAKDMQAICDVRGVCDKNDIIARFQTIGGESLLMVGDTTEKK